MRIGKEQGRLIAAVALAAMAAAVCVLMAAVPSAEGGTGAEDLVVNGDMTFDADLECGTITVNKGTLTVNGSLKCGDVAVSDGSKVAVSGDAETGALSVAGSFDVKGSLSAGDLTVDRVVTVGGDLSAENIIVNGYLRIYGTLSSKNLTTGEDVRVILPGKFYCIDVRGKLDVFKDMIYQDTRSSGDITIGGRHRYGDITVRQYFAVDGEVSASKISIEDGAVATMGRDVSAESLAVSGGGMLTVKGDLSCKESESLGAEHEHMLDVAGSVNAGGDLSFDKAIVGGTLNVAGDLDVESIKVSGSLGVDGKMDIGTFVAEKGHDISGDISVERLIVPEGASFSYQWSLNAEDLLVLGTFRAEAPFSAERVFVGMALTSDEPFVGGSAVLTIPEGTSISGLKALYVAEGATVGGLTGTMESTSYVVDGVAYAKAYMPSGGSLKVSDLRVPASGGTVASGWTLTLEGKEAPVGDMIVGGADEVHASLCKAAVQAGEGFAKVFIDKAEAAVGGSLSLSPGVHTVAWTLMDGYSGKDVVLKLDGVAVSGGSIVIPDDGKGCTISLTVAEPVSEDGGKPVGTALVVAVMAAVIAVALAGYGIVRSGSR